MVKRLVILVEEEDQMARSYACLALAAMAYDIDMHEELIVSDYEIFKSYNG